MAGKNADRIMETSTTTGDSDFTLAGAVTGYRTFDTAFGTDRALVYCIEGVDGDGVPSGEWEIGVGHLSASTTLVRDSVRHNSAASEPTKLTFSAGTKNVFNPFTGLAARKSTHGFDLQYGTP